MSFPETNSARSFISQVISFAMLGLSLYGLAHLYQLASTEPIIKHTKKCKYCRQRINEKVGGKFLDVQKLANNHSLRDASIARAGSMEERTSTKSIHDTPFSLWIRIRSLRPVFIFISTVISLLYLQVAAFVHFLGLFAAFLHGVFFVRAD